MSVVSFGRRQKFKFIESEKLRQINAAEGPALYAATYKQDAIERPKSHTVVYFGETADVSKNVATIRSELKDWWYENGTNSELFIFFHIMPGSSQLQRANIQRQLILEYDPQGNR